MVKCECGTIVPDEDIRFTNTEMRTAAYWHTIQADCDKCSKTIVTDGAGLIIDVAHASKILQVGIDQRQNKIKGIKRAVEMRHSDYKSQGHPKITNAEWKRKSDVFGRAIVLYYSDGSIGLKKP